MRFVLLYHDCPPAYVRPSHWDLMLEVDQAGTACLRTWALPQLPGEWAAMQARTAELHPECAAVGGSDSVAAEQLGNHRLDYLELEGPLSGNRGSVTRIEAGDYMSEAEPPERWHVVLNGSVWSGRIVLERGTADGCQWTLRVCPESAASW